MSHGAETLMEVLRTEVVINEVAETVMRAGLEMAMAMEGIGEGVRRTEDGTAAMEVRGAREVGGTVMAMAMAQVVNQVVGMTILATAMGAEVGTLQGMGKRQQPATAEIIRCGRYFEQHITGCRGWRMEDIGYHGEALLPLA